ncbi:GNAT acetyltransferase 2-domain-containing protein [Colletotrichum godetiae]|uniref:RNA cytidine acetyltransferase n=1 Tax=Colletotrichum godetiae TaxID=1209918 RepID=A0AAJ0AED2_9PEZI|nr:GNAT acetyltransferase 2-domain-containing protein [Colletotrichum godetiae]KAK1672319.1 GNAT acetyltransferase 2-domain-containing protein [Colletotrichum godetiae]
MFSPPNFWDFLDVEELVCADPTSASPLSAKFPLHSPYVPPSLRALFKMSRKAVDQRIPNLISNGYQEKKRSFFVVVGDHSKDVIVNLHYLMARNIKQNKSVLWAYKTKLLGFTSHRKKRENKIKKEIKHGTREANESDPFELFVSLHNIRYVYYKETEKVLGQTFGMCILQDFEAMTPNILARTIETVEGGGLVVLLLKGMSSLKQLYTMSMDIHSRYRTEAHDDVVARFNERFILSLGGCDSCLVIDDEMNVLPISGGKGVVKLPPTDKDINKTEAEQELEDMKESLQDTQPVGSLVTLAKTTDQAKALLTFVDAIAEKTLRSTVTLTAARGRGKSAAMGVAVAAAVAHGYSNIFITSPSPENLKTLFEFVFKGFDALGYADHADYSIIQSTNPDFNKAIVRVNIHRAHRQTIQYIRPQDAHVLGQAELVVIDEAAAIPLPLVRKLMGPYLVFMASTINGYEGTGRSLSLKLIKQLREQSRPGAKTGEDTEVADRTTGKASKDQGSSQSSRSLREITLSEPIRYAQGDLVEKWLNKLLCLDATLPKAKASAQGCPDPSQCELLKVNRDTLFSFHPIPEKFLQQMVALYVASHYKNSPDDLQLMSDAPAHELYVLIAPTSDGKLPEPLCVIQVALEGKISRQSVINQLSRGQRPSGDLIPWLVSQQYQDDEFASLSGARVVRIATNPEYVSMGYGTKALQLLTDFYEQKFTNLSEDADLAMEETLPRVTDAELSNTSLLADDVHIRDIKKLPPLFARFSEIRPAALDYVGVSYGLTQPLHKFWKRASFAPVYLRQTANDLTGEHTCVMIRPLENTGADRSWLGAFSRDFQRRFQSLLSYQFREFQSVVALSIDESASIGAKLDGTEPTALSKVELDRFLTPFDLKRLESYANNMLDYHVILDLVPTLAGLYFTGKLKGDIKLTGVQQAILLAIGLQRKDMDVISSELSLPSSQLLAMFIKILRKITTHFGSLVNAAVEAELPSATKIGVSRENASGVHDDEVVDKRFAPLETSLEDELEEGGDEALAKLRRKQRELIDSLPLDQYEVDGDAPAWAEAEQAVKDGKTGVVSVKGKSKRKAGPTAAEIYDEALGEKKSKKAKKSKRDRD